MGKEWHEVCECVLPHANKRRKFNHGFVSNKENLGQTGIGVLGN